jgi:hypothetical protein
MSISRRSIRVNGKNGIGDLTGMGRALTTTGAGSTTTLVCSTLANLALTIREGAIILLNGGTYEGSERMVTAHDKTTGTLTFAPALAGAPGSGVAFELWEPQTESVANVNAALNRVLTTRCHYWKLVPLGMLTNGDCQSTAGWTASGSITAALAVHAFPYRLGRYYLAITNTLATDYLYQVLRVVEDLDWEIAVLMRPGTDTTVRVKLYDLTNGAYITPSDDTLETELGTAAGTSVDWRVFRSAFTVPDNCLAVRVEVGNSVAGKVGHLGWIAVWPSDAHSLPIPDRVTSEENIGRIFKWSENVDMGPAETWDMDEYTRAWPVRLARGGLSVRFPTSLGSNGPFFYEELTHYEAIDSDETNSVENTTDCPDDYVCYVAAYEFARYVADRQRILHPPQTAGVKNTSWDELALARYAEANSVAAAYVHTPLIAMRSV